MSNLSSPKERISRKNFGNSSSPHSTYYGTAKSGSVGASQFSTFRDKPHFHNLSASVLQHSSVSFRFPQAKRFPKIRTVGPRSYCGSPSSISGRTTTLGFGNRVDVSEYGNKESLVFPSPDRYKIKSEFEEYKGKGKTFGMSFAAYEKVYIPGNREIPIPFTKHFPGPGAYYSDKDITADMTKVFVTSRGKMFNEKLNLDSPKCSQYSPKDILMKNTRFTNTTFGFGTKYDFTKAPNDYPGPGTYNPPSFVDKLRKRKKRFVSKTEPK